MKLVWSPKAVADLAQVRAFIARDKPVAAKKTVLAILAYTENQLSQYPNSGRPGRVEGTLELVIPKLPYIVPYRLIRERIEILRVFHAARLWPDQL